MAYVGPGSEGSVRSTGSTGSGGVRFMAPGQPAQFPLLAHANGYGNESHSRLSQLMRAAKVAAFSGDVGEATKMREWPVLLVDAASTPKANPCQVVSLGRLLESTV